MRKFLSLCEFLADAGGLRLTCNGLDTVGASDLRAMGAGTWHRCKPFRKKLVRLDSGLCPDDAALAAWKAGYFPECDDRPEIDDLLEAIADELSGTPVYTLNDRRAIFERDHLPQTIN